MTARVDGAAPPLPAAAPAHSVASRPSGAFRAALDRALEALDRAGRPVAAPSGASGDVDPTASLALQAEIYRQAERVELASKLLDHAVGAVKTVLQTKV